MNGVRSTANFGHSRSGTCGVCGDEGKLSWTHVPPRCVGNVGPARSLVLAPDPAGGGSVTSLGHEKEGGAAGYFLCVTCNNDAGKRYDQGFGTLWNLLASRFLVNNEMPPEGGPHPLSVGGIDPGAVVRSVLSGMMALNPALRVQFPVLQRAVQRNLRVKTPDHLHLLLGLHSDEFLRVSGGGAERQELRGGRLVRSTFVHAEIDWSPLYLVLTDPTGREYWKTAQDILPWLADVAGQQREVNLLLPVLTNRQLFGRAIHDGARRAEFNGPNNAVLWAAWLYWTTWLLPVPFIIAAIVRLRREHVAAWPLYWLIALYFVVSALLTADPRYASSCQPALAVLVGVGVTTSITALRQRHRGDQTPDDHPGVKGASASS